MGTLEGCEECGEMGCVGCRRTDELARLAAVVEATLPTMYAPSKTGLHNNLDRMRALMVLAPALLAVVREAVAPNADGEPACAFCILLDGEHEADCKVGALRAQIREVLGE